MSSSAPAVRASAKMQDAMDETIVLIILMNIIATVYFFLLGLFQVMSDYFLEIKFCYVGTIKS